MSFKTLENTDEITLCLKSSSNHIEKSFQKWCVVITSWSLHTFLKKLIFHITSLLFHFSALKGHTHLKVRKTNNQTTKKSPAQKTKTKPYTNLNVKRIEIHTLAWKCCLFQQSWGYSHAYNHVYWTALTNQAVLPAWEVWYDCAYMDNCWHVQESLMAATQSPVFLAVVSLEYPEINRVSWHLSSRSCY